MEQPPTKFGFEQPFNNPNEPPTHTGQYSSKPPTPLKFKKIGITILILGFVIGLIYGVGAIFADKPSDLVKEMEIALKEGNAEKLQGLIRLENSDEDIPLDQVKLFINSGQQKNKYVSSIITELQSQASLLESDLSNELIVDPGYGMKFGNDFNLKRTEIPLFYDQYEIVARPYTIKILAKEPDTRLLVNGKEVFKTTKDKLFFVYGPALPATYKVQAAMKVEFGELMTSAEAEAIDKSQTEVEVNLENKGESLKLSSYFDHTKLIVNEKPTGKLVKDILEFGPISLDGSMTIQGETKMPWGVEKSAIIKLDKNAVDYTGKVDLNPVPLASAELRKQVTEVINQFAKQRIEAQIKENSKILTTIDDNLRKKYVDEIENLKSSTDQKIKGKALGTKIDFDGTLVTNYRETSLYQVQVPVEFHQLYKKYFWSFEENEQPKEEYDTRLLTLTYVEKTKQWVISDESSMGFNKKDNYMNNASVVKTDF